MGFRGGAEGFGGHRGGWGLQRVSGVCRGKSWRGGAGGEIEGGGAGGKRLRGGGEGRGAGGAETGAQVKAHAVDTFHLSYWEVCESTHYAVM